MTRGTYMAWLWALGIALGVCVLVATLGTVLRLEGCVIDATDAVLDAKRELAAVWIVPPDGAGPAVAWTYSSADAHIRWARARQLDQDERRRYLARHREELQTRAPIQGWLVNGAFPRDGTARTVRPTPQLSLDRPLEPLSVGGALAAALLLFLLLGLVSKRRRWVAEQARWASERGLGAPGDVAPTDF